LFIDYCRLAIENKGRRVFGYSSLVAGFICKITGADRSLIWGWINDQILRRWRRPMRILASVLLLSCLLYSDLKVHAQSKDAEEIKSAEMDLAAAEHRSESAPFKKLMADDWITITPEGRVLHREDMVRNIAEHEGQRTPYIVKLVGLRVDVFGDMAVASCTREYHGISGEAEGSVRRESVVDVYTKTGGGWKMRYAKAVPLGAD
jgi:ketosteroid isomerase-like protein